MVNEVHLINDQLKPTMMTTVIQISLDPIAPLLSPPGVAVVTFVRVQSRNSLGGEKIVQGSGTSSSQVDR